MVWPDFLLIIHKRATRPRLVSTILPGTHVDEKLPPTSSSGWHLAAAGDNPLAGATQTACLGFVLWEKAASVSRRTWTNN
jgi:hypothetical protein